jgi:hypothetical protein
MLSSVYKITSLICINVIIIIIITIFNYNYECDVINLSFLYLSVCFYFTRGNLVTGFLANKFALK